MTVATTVIIQVRIKSLFLGSDSSDESSSMEDSSIDINKIK